MENPQSRILLLRHLLFEIFDKGIFGEIGDEAFVFQHALEVFGFQRFGEARYVGFLHIRHLEHIQHLEFRILRVVEYVPVLG